MNKHAQSGKEERQRIILEVIGEQAIGTQQQLVSALKRLGLRITQASVSRDIAELGLIKVAGRYRPGEPGAGASDPDLPFRLWVQKVLMAGANLVVIKAVAGTAGRIGLALDHRDLPEIIGTVAGDDTIFVAVSGQAAGRRLQKFIRDRLTSGASDIA